MADGSEEPGGGASAAVAPGAPAGTFEPLRSRVFREVWMGNVCSQLGGQIQAVGAAWLMTELTTSHMLVAAVQASNVLPMLFLSVIAGGLADNYNRRRIMLLSQWSMLIVSTALAVLAWRGSLGAAGLLLFTLAVGCGGTVNMPAWHASVRVMVNTRSLPQAISLNSIAYNLARTVGPALGGLVLATAGVAAAFALNALSYVALIVALARWKPDLPPPPREPLLPSIRAGLGFCLQSSPVRRIILRGVGFSVGVISVQALLPVVVRTQLGGGETGYGLMLGLFGVGSIGGALASPALRRRYGADHTLAIGAALSFVAVLMVGFATSLVTLVPGPLLAGFGWSMGMTTLSVAMQLRSPEEILGRCLAIYQAVTLGAAAVGAWCWGLLADLTAVDTAMFCAAGWVAAAGLVLRVAAPLPARGEGVVIARP
jgi:MFS family permease